MTHYKLGGSSLRIQLQADFGTIGLGIEGYIRRRGIGESIRKKRGGRKKRKAKKWQNDLGEKGDR